MPFVGGNDDDFHLARKRRWDDDDNIYYCDQLHAGGGGGGGGYGSLFDQGQFQQQHQQQHQHPGFYHLDLDLPRPSCKTILPLPSKRARVAVAGADTTTITNNNNNNNNSSSSNNNGSLHDTRSPRRRVSQQRLQEQLTTSKRPTTATLAPCHICHRRPTRKSDLDCFADCQGCGQRACFICIRQCQGRANDEQLSDDVSADVDEGVRMLSRSITMDDYEAQPEGEDQKEDQNGDAPGPWRRLQHRHRHHHHHHHKHHRHHSRRDDDDDNATSRDLQGWAASGHRSVVCSRCCVEKGHQGEVVCLGCLCEMPGA
ncbi:hypothetical protein AAL_00617 [Moelleriella libera RCEF 2490]|uniref:Uncharacterized protein n=1 Tax=Moelleriella libera RCEF 2490 TaxID=1081109 RepID=A0A166UZU5_9HYPO|nr:hypothetical protein AAL_00617 [Moelleriella libera RCEF 2490]